MKLERNRSAHLGSRKLQSHNRARDEFGLKRNRRNARNYRWWFIRLIACPCGQNDRRNRESEQEMFHKTSWLVKYFDAIVCIAYIRVNTEEEVGKKIFCAMVPDHHSYCRKLNALARISISPSQPFSLYCSCDWQSDS